jgi:hypothetical protein
MKRKIVLTILLLIILSPLIMWVLWLLKPVSIHNVFILDKTVLLTDVQEHLSLSWVINNKKLHHSTFGNYIPEIDYYGFFPEGNGEYHIKDIEQFTEQQLDSLVKVYDMVFYTDMYGVYHNEWDATYFPEREKDERYISMRSQRIYGGMTQQELLFLKKMRENRKLIINEFNLIGSPTSGAVRRDYERSFGVEWSGWIGRYYDNLDTLVNKDIPRWLINNHMHQYGEWPHRKSGIAFVREDDRVVILEDSTHLIIDLPFILTERPFVKEYGIAKKMKYPFWFDIVKADTALTIASTYELYPNVNGAALLQKWGIPERFPALVVSEDKLYYYLAGDFSDNPINYWSSYLIGVHCFSWLGNKNYKTERRSFFWRYYRPLLKKIIRNNVEYVKSE